MDSFTLKPFIFTFVLVIVSSYLCLIFGQHCFNSGFGKCGPASDNLKIDDSSTMPLSLTNSFVLKASVPAQAVVIFLHGLGDNGQGWSAAFDSIKRQDVQYIFPNAAPRPVTLNGGFRMPAWYDLRTLDGKNEDEEGIISASKDLEKLIEEVLTSTNVPSTRVFLGGFSQGGSLALHTGLMFKKQLGGIIALSSWLPLHELFTSQSKEHSLQNQKCKLFQAHGSQDPVVNFKFGQLSHNCLKTSVLENPVFKVYPGMGHESSPQELADIKSFIDECLVTS